jgi:hypothetical protein
LYANVNFSLIFFAIEQLKPAASPTERHIPVKAQGNAEPLILKSLRADPDWACGGQ